MAVVQRTVYVELLATDIAGRQSDTRRTIEIRTSDKTADFVTSASDFALELDGVALNFQRSYSSLDASMAGLLGYGWKLDAAEPRLALVLAQNEPAGAALPPALHAGAGLFVDLPDGQRVPFAFQPVPLQVGNRVLFRPAWVVPDDVGYRLESADAVLEQVQDRFYQIGSGLPYNPAADFPAGVDYTLVTPNGFRYEYDATAGLQAMVSPEGRRLVWSDSGIVASSGDRVSFQKDPAGRISIVTLPDGQQIFYDYDAEGHLVRVLRGADAVRTDLGYTATSPRLLDHVIRTDQVGQQVRYAPDGTLLAVDVVSRYLGGSREFLGQTITGTLPAQSVDRSAFVMTSAELNQTATGQLTLGIAVYGTNGFQPAAASASGAMTALSRVAAGMSISLVTLPVAGIHTLAVLGVDSSTAGNYQATIYLPGDVNQDGAVDGLDRTRFEQVLGSVQGQPQYLQSADADRDGDVDLNDAVWLDQNFGFVANRAPQVASHTVRTHVDVPVVVELEVWRRTRTDNRWSRWSRVQSTDGSNASRWQGGRFTPARVSAVRPASRSEPAMVHAVATFDHHGGCQQWPRSCDSLESGRAAAGWRSDDTIGGDRRFRGRVRREGTGVVLHLRQRCSADLACDGLRSAACGGRRHDVSAGHTRRRLGVCSRVGGTARRHGSVGDDADGI